MPNETTGWVDVHKWKRSQREIIDDQRLVQALSSEKKGVRIAKNAEKKKKTKTIAKIFPEEEGHEISGESAEDRQLRRLKSRLKPLRNHKTLAPVLTQVEHRLPQWLRAAQGNVWQAAACVCRHVVWRRESCLDTVLAGDSTPQAVLRTYYPGGMCGVDKEGSPVCYDLLGLVDMKGLCASVSRQELFRFKLHQYETILRHIKDRKSRGGGRKCRDDVTVVVDMRGMDQGRLWGPGLVVWAEMLQLVARHYPGLVKEVLVVLHTGGLLVMEVLASLRPHMDGWLRGRISVLGHNATSHLLRKIDKEELPAFLGGYRCDHDGDGTCPGDINWESKVPEWTYFTDPIMHAEVTAVRVPGGGRDVTEIVVTCPGSRLSWEMHKVSQPFMMAVHRDSLADPRAKVFGRTRISQQSALRNHVVACPAPGRYLIVWDNSSHAAATLEVKLRLEVMYPDTVRTKLDVNRPVGDSVDFTRVMTEREREMERERNKEGPGWRWPKTTTSGAGENVDFMA